MHANLSLFIKNKGKLITGSWKVVVCLAKIPSLWIYEKKPSSVFSDNKTIHLQGKNPQM